MDRPGRGPLYALNSSRESLSGFCSFFSKRPNKITYFQSLGDQSLTGVGCQMTAQTVADQVEILGLDLKPGEQTLDEVGQRISEHRQISDAA